MPKLQSIISKSTADTTCIAGNHEAHHLVPILFRSTVKLTTQTTFEVFVQEGGKEEQGAYAAGCYSTKSERWTNSRKASILHYGRWFS